MVDIPLIPLIIGESIVGGSFSYCGPQPRPLDDKDDDYDDYDDSKLNKKEDATMSLIVVLWSLACMLVGFFIGLKVGNVIVL